MSTVLEIKLGTEVLIFYFENTLIILFRYTAFENNIFFIVNFAIF